MRARYTGVLGGSGQQPAWAAQDSSVEWPVLTPVSSLLAGAQADPEPMAEPAAQPEPQPGRQPQGMASKWGFVPGEDDTLDLNLERRGACCCLLTEPRPVQLCMCCLEDSAHVPSSPACTWARAQPLTGAAAQGAR